MAMEISLQGYNSKYVTLKTEGKIEAGDMVAISSNNTVKKAVAGKFAGQVKSVRGSYALVQTGGYVEARYSGTLPTVGFIKMAADANAGLTTSDTGREVMVTSVDASETIVGLMF